jgi:hypothetical protein
VKDLLPTTENHRSADRGTCALEDAEDYKAFEAVIIADYEAQSAVERELALRLASLLWRLRRAATMETGLFEIQANHLREFRQARKILAISREVIYALFRGADCYDHSQALHTQIRLPHRILSDLLTMPRLTSRSAFYVFPIYPTSHSIV